MIKVLKSFFFFQFLDTSKFKKNFFLQNQKTELWQTTNFQIDDTRIAELTFLFKLNFRLQKNLEKFKLD